MFWVGFNLFFFSMTVKLQCFEIFCPVACYPGDPGSVYNVLQL